MMTAAVVQCRQLPRHVTAATHKPVDWQLFCFPVIGSERWTGHTHTAPNNPIHLRAAEESRTPALLCPRHQQREYQQAKPSLRQQTCTNTRPQPNTLSKGSWPSVSHALQIHSRFSRVCTREAAAN
jgi:hypothetical protein